MDLRPTRLPVPVVLASVGGCWEALDPYFDVAFRAPDGTLLAAEDIRFTKWQGISVDRLGAFRGGVSLRTHFRNLHWVVAAAATGSLLPVSAIQRTASPWAMTSRDFPEGAEPHHRWARSATP